MRYAVLSDIHSNLLGLELIIEDALSRGIDKFIFLGDYVSDGYQDNEVISLVEQYGTYIVKGNREEVYLELNAEKTEIIRGQKNDYENIKTLQYTINNLSVESYDYLKKIPMELEFKINNKKILLTHGHKYLGNETELAKKITNNGMYDLVLFGHTHMYIDFEYSGTRFINPGSAGMPCDTASYKYGILTIGDEIEFELREIPTADTFEQLESEYKATRYFKENPEYGTLVLMEIRDGYPYVPDFIHRIRSFEVRDLNAYSKLWHEQFEIFYEKIKKEDNNIV